jgi:small subunit ribosomal protein S7
MSRKKRVLKRPAIIPDKTFNSVLISRLINRVMWDGKKTTASKLVNLALMKASEELQIAPLEVIETAVDNVKPQIEVKSMRVGGASYQVPMEPYPARALRLALTWIVGCARDMKGKSTDEKLKDILIQSYKGEGPAVAKRNTVHQLAAGNKAFAHFAAWAKKKN